MTAVLIYLLFGLLCALVWWFGYAKKQYKSSMNGREKKNELVLGFHILVFIWPLWIVYIIFYFCVWFTIHFRELYMKAFNAILGR